MQCVKRRADRVPVSEPWMPPKGGTLRLQDGICGEVIYDDRNAFVVPIKNRDTIGG